MYCCMLCASQVKILTSSREHFRCLEVKVSEHVLYKQQAKHKEHCAKTGSQKNPPDIVL